MPVTTISSRTFNQDTSGAKKASLKGPVVITDRGRPSHVLLTYADYETLKTLDKRNILDLLACPEAAEIDFEIPKLELSVRDIDLS